MRILLINAPHPSIGSRIPDDHLPPLGLLSVGGPLIDDGHQVKLLDAEFGPMSTAAILREVVTYAPDAILFGHSGSTSGHPVIAALSRAVARVMPDAWIVYGGVFPSYHWREVLEEERQVDVVVVGEGEETGRRVMAALEQGKPPHSVLGEIPGVAFRGPDGLARATRPAPMVADLDACRVGWELIDHARYSYWGGKRAVVAQFSRGCPHLCNYCGQRGFWTKWRHRDPVRFARELADLARNHGVEVINFADENPTSSRRVWKAFLEALIAEDVKLILVGSTRADDIVRDADILHLYRQAGWERFLLGLESTDEATLAKIRKGGATATDREAVRLLRAHGILSMASWVVGFEEETDADHWRGLRQLLAYDPDQVQLLYVTPHRWTPFYRLAAGRTVIQLDRRRWDYKHQVLATRHMPPWRVLLWVKFAEAVMQLRPRALWRVLTLKDPSVRRAQRWYYQMGRRVWPFELWNFLFRDRRVKDGPTLAEFWGTPQDDHETSMQTRPARLALAKAS
jgi:anaerobic magnesium-protoporphyrin IX monomethyl ester cyclase